MRSRRTAPRRWAPGAGRVVMSFLDLKIISNRNRSRTCSPGSADRTCRSTPSRSGGDPPSGRNRKLSHTLWICGAGPCGRFRRSRRSSSVGTWDFHFRIILKELLLVSAAQRLIEADPLPDIERMVDMELRIMELLHKRHAPSPHHPSRADRCCARPHNTRKSCSRSPRSCIQHAR